MEKHDAALALSIFLTPLSQVILRSGAGKSTSAVASFLNVRTAMSYSLFLVVVVLMNYALQTIPLHTATAWNSLSFVLTPLAAHFLLGDRITRRALLGSAFIVAGILIFCS